MKQRATRALLAVTLAGVGCYSGSEGSAGSATASGTAGTATTSQDGSGSTPTPTAGETGSATAPSGETTPPTGGPGGTETTGDPGTTGGPNDPDCEIDDTCEDNNPSSCGDGVCDATDHCDTCPDDCGACSGSSPEVVRGPYLQRGGPDSLVLMWRTASASSSSVSFGQSTDDFKWSVNDDAQTTDHEVEITGLTPGARYYYGFGAADAPLLGKDEDHRFVTSPSPGTDKPTRVWVIGDSGQAGSGQQAVRDAYIDYAGDRPANLWLMLGDNAYNDGTDSEYQEAVFDADAYQALLRNTMLYATIGNHERVDAGGAYLDIFSLPTTAQAGGLESSTEYYYSFDYGIIHFVCLDSDTNESSETAMTWLRNDLEANDQPWLIAFWHHPPYTNGSHNSDDEGSLGDMRENYLPILESHGVDMVFSGHSHSYERSVFLYGHYGESGQIYTNPELILAVNGDGEPADGMVDGPYQKVPAADCPDIGTALESGASCGTVYSVVGSSAKVSASDYPTRYDGGPKLPSMFTYQETLGSVVIDIDGDTADIIFLDSGPDDDPYPVAEVSDEYRIVK